MSLAASWGKCSSREMAWEAFITEDTSSTSVKESVLDRSEVEASTGNSPLGGRALGRPSCWSL
ncbi:hypothetical protein ACN28S_34610 [Cystobacter fuscus]